MMQRLTAIITIFLLVVSNLVFLQPEVSHAAALENGVTISVVDGAGDDILPMTAVSIDEGDTAFDVLNEVTTVIAEDTNWGKDIKSIDGTTLEGTNFWAFYVNGKASNLGSSSYQVTNGDNLLFVYTDWTQTVEELNVTVSAIANEGAEVIPETVVKLVPGATSYDALMQAASEHSVEVLVTVYSDYFSFVNNIGNVDLGTDWWHLGVNGTELQVGAISYEVAEGDHVQFTTDGTLLPPEDSEPETPVDPVAGEPITDSVVEENITNILSYIESNNVSLTYGNEWWIWGLANAGAEMPVSYLTSVIEEVKEVDGNIRSVFDLEKVIIGLSAVGSDASSIVGYDLIDKLVNHKNLENPSINMLIYALLAVDSGQYETPADFRTQLIDSILAQEIDGGGWSLMGNTPSADMTGMVLASLAPYSDQANVQAAIDRAVQFLSTAQDATGGYSSGSNGGDSSESVAQVIIGLSTVGVDPTGDAFTKAGGNLVQHLLKFKQADGGFSHLLEEESSNEMSIQQVEGSSDAIATQQAMLALQAYQNFVNGSGSVYQFTSDPSPVEPVADENENKLPNTATSTTNMMLIGFALLFVGGALFFINRKRAA